MEQAGPNDGTRTVTAQLLTIEVDRSQYKKYQPLLAFKNVYVTLHTPVEECVEDGDSIIVSVKGLTAILEEVAMEVDILEEKMKDEAGKRAEKLEQALQMGVGED